MNKKVKAIYCIGELLIDFVCTDKGTDLSIGENFLKKPGGAPANVAAAAARLGGNAHFVGAVGTDPFGNFLADYITQFGVGTDLLQRSDRPTTLAFVALAEDGERDFVFNRGADADLQLNDELLDMINRGGLYHFGAATSFLPGALKETYRIVLDSVKDKGNFISFDPNYREAFWAGHEKEFVAHCQPFLEKANVVKVSDEELTILTDEQDIAQGAQQLLDKGPEVVFVTLGSKGCYVATHNGHFTVPPYQIEVQDTTGAGDAFIGAILYQVSVQGWHTDQEHLTQYVQFASKVGGLVCSKLGAMTALPTLDDVNSTVFVEKTDS